MSVFDNLAATVAGPAGYLTVLLAIALLVDHDLVREQQIEGLPPAGRRLDIRALVMGAVVVLASLTIMFRLLVLAS